MIHTELTMSARKELVVKQSHALAISAYGLSRNAKRVLYLALIEINKAGNSLEFNHEEGGYEVSVYNDDYIDISGDKQNARRDILKASREMRKQAVRVYTPELDEDGEKAHKERNWLAGFNYEPKNKRTVLVFNSYIVNLIKYKKGDPFTQYLLISASRLNSPYSMRLYELICQWRSTRHSFKFDLDWLFERYQLPESYRRMPDLRRKFLELTKNEISENTDITITDWKEDCLGERKNKVTHVTVYWSEKKSINKLEADERKKLEQQSDIDIAELVTMEESILATDELDTFSRVLISGYQAIAKEYDYYTPKNVQSKIKELIG